MSFHVQSQNLRLAPCMEQRRLRLELGAHLRGGDPQGIPTLAEVAVRAKREDEEILRRKRSHHRGDLFRVDAYLAHRAGSQLLRRRLELGENGGELHARGGKVEIAGV